MRVDKIKKAKLRRRLHVRKKIFGVAERPRLSIFRSNRHIYAQIIDDTVGITLASANTRSKSIRDDLKKTGNIDAAKLIGVSIAKQAKQVGIQCVKFDRNRYKFHGRVETLAKAARKSGLDF